jgi:hypothetical protein
MRTMTRSAATFTSSGMTGSISPGHSENPLVGDILVMALANEQQAHAKAKAALGVQIDRCVGLEAQVRKCEQKMASMEATISSLGAIVKHNAKQFKTQTDANHVPIWPREQEEAGLREFYRKYNKANEAAAEKDRGNLLFARRTSTPDSLTTSLLPADTELYNLDLLQEPDDDNDNPTDSALRRTLRKHFSIETNDETFTPAKSAGRASLKNLLEISPPSAKDATKEDVSKVKGSVPNDAKPASSPTEPSASGLTSTQVRLPVGSKVHPPPQIGVTDFIKDTQEPALGNLEAVIAKYARKPIPSSQVLPEKVGSLLNQI